MSSDITLSSGVRQNLLSLQNTASLMAQTQNRLATGKKVNSALDNPLNFFTSQSLSSRAHDLSGLLDSMGSAIQTVQAASNGITAMTALVKQLQATVSSARGDTTPAAIAPGSLTAGTNTSALGGKLTFNLGGGTSVSLDTYNHVNATVSTVTAASGTYTTDLSANGFSINDGTTNTAITFAAGDLTLAAKITKINSQLATAGNNVHAQDDGNGNLQLVNSTGNTITVTEGAGTTAATLGFGAGNTTSTDGSAAVNTAFTVDELVSAINSNSILSGKVSASKDATTGALKLSNLTNTNFTVTGTNGTNVTGLSTDTSTLSGGTGASLSSVRQSLLNQFNSLVSQIDKTALDSGYNGINLLNGDKLHVQFNETNTSSIDVQAIDGSGNAFAINSTNLGINAQTTSNFASNTTLDSLASTLTTALTTLRSQASALGSQLSVVQTRQDFTKNMINTLQTGSDNLVLADTNEEGANMLALQTRQSLSTTALSLASQANQNVLRLFG
ncbi:MAG: Flagellar cap protein FliD [Pseudolabrys sp.]|jgi:flagellin-like hook-associated protein FlgL|nr:Flagellar cap protein FliD [Pseudolabrys sp.]